MTGDQQESSSQYGRALEAARALGRADGELEAALGLALPEDPGPAAVGAWCRGRDPEHFAALVWGTAGATAPAGVVRNAPLWYAQGFRESLSRARMRQDPRVPAPRPAPAPGTAGPAAPPAVSAWPRPRRPR